MEPFQEENIEDVTISRYFAILQVNTVHLTKGGGRGEGSNASVHFLLSFIVIFRVSTTSTKTSALK